jgi:bacteriocin-like protein
MEKTVSKTNDTSNMNTERELSNDELDAVSGGVFDFGNLIAQWW